MFGGIFIIQYANINANNTVMFVLSSAPLVFLILASLLSCFNCVNISFISFTLIDLKNNA